MFRKQFNEHQRWQMARLIGAVRWGQVWFKPPAPPKVTAVRASLVSSRETAPGTCTTDFAVQAETNAEWADRELNRPTSTKDQATATIAGKPYHWTQTYDGVLRLHAGASPW